MGHNSKRWCIRLAVLFLLITLPANIAFIAYSSPKAKFNRIRNGMSLEQVRGLLGQEFGWQSDEKIVSWGNGTPDVIIVWLDVDFKVRGKKFVNRLTPWQRARWIFSQILREFGIDYPYHMSPRWHGPYSPDLAPQ